jgi:hypothetical protein
MYFTREGTESGVSGIVRDMDILPESAFALAHHSCPWSEVKRRIFLVFRGPKGVLP